MKYLVVVALVFFIPIACVYSQNTDSLKVYLVGSKRGESILMYYDGKLLVDFKSKGRYFYSFSILRDSNWVANQSDLTKFSFYKRAKFGIRFRNLNLTPLYEAKENLIIRRNRRLKNKFAFDYVWSDEEPKGRIE